MKKSVNIEEHGVEKDERKKRIMIEIMYPYAEERKRNVSSPKDLGSEERHRIVS